MSAVSQQTSTSQSSNQTGCVVDPLDLLDFTDYDSMPDGMPSYESPSLSPSSSKAQFTARPPATVTPPTTLPPSTMAGPSHQYDQYKQQTPFVPGALASTMAVNQNIAGYDVNYMPPEMTSPDDIFDFNTAGPAQNAMSSPEMDMDFEPSGDASFFFESTVNPTAIGSREAHTPVATSNVGRMYPGMHQQAALAKARAAQQQQQQQIIQQQQRQQQQQQQQQQQGIKHQRTKSNQPSDPIVEQKITQLLNSMRAQSAGSDGSGNSPLHNLPRTKKDEEDMDDDERLLNSEEGKKLSSKERRQLRNKVSARAFRSRRKEYISQLESEIASKVSENGDLRSQNRALMDENRRLSDLTRMLLSSSSFSNFLEHLSTNPAAPTPAQAAQPQRAEQRREEPRQAPKDVNPYAAAQQAQPPTNMVMVPEQTMEFSMLNINNSNEAAFNYQPQVFSVVETPEIPEIDVAALSGKGSDSLSFETEQGKVEIPVAEAPVLLESAKPEMPETPAPAPSSARVVADLDSDIFDDETATPTEYKSPESADLFAGVQLEKMFARYVLVDASDEEAVSNSAMMRVQRITASIEATMNRLERLTAGL